MKFSNIKYYAVSVLLAGSLMSCSDFLDRPAEDSYNADNYYQTVEQCQSATNYLYNSPWYDFLRGFIKMGEVLSGNYFWAQSPYLTFTVNGTNEDLMNMSKSLWAEIAHCNTVYNSLAAARVDESVKGGAMGECLTLKALAYFYLVRSFGDVPIIHDNSASLNAGDYNSLYKVQKADVYEYIIMTLEKAMELLPADNGAGRIDYYCAEALLAKVYLTRAGVTGTLNADDLAKAASYAKDVIDNSGRKLMENYEDIFRLKNNISDESLIAWRWKANGAWTTQNSLQSDLAMTSMDEFGDCWGGWNGISVDLQKAFGIDLLKQQPDAWINNVDTRLKATMMLPGFTYSYFWRDHGGFDYLRYIFDETYFEGGTLTNATLGTLESATGANCVKHLYGNTSDHVAELNESPARMSYSLATHLLRLSDVYLIYAEAKMGTAKQTSDASAIDAFYAVRHRAIKNYQRPTSITWDDVWKERRLEFAMEGDRWYDYVRVAYYDADYCINELKSQQRNQYWNLETLYKTYFESGVWDPEAAKASYDSNTGIPSVTKESFVIPPYQDDVIANPNLLKDPIHVDIRETYSY